MLLGENVTVSVTADMTLNLQGFQGNGTPSILPGLGPMGIVALALVLGGIGETIARRR